MIVSFGWTTPALLAGAKTVTRRDWKPEHAARFKAGMLVDAWNTSPRNTRGGPAVKVGTIRLTADPSLELTRQAPEEDWQAEGFEYLSAKGLRIDGHTPEEHWFNWRRHGNQQCLWVVRFELIDLTDAGERMKAAL